MENWKLGHTSLDEHIAANRWQLMKLHMDTSTTSGKFEAWLRPLGGKTVKVAEWIDGVTPDFAWKIPVDKVGGYKVFRIPTTIGGFGERAQENKDCSFCGRFCDGGVGGGSAEVSGVRRAFQKGQGARREDCGRCCAGQGFYALGRCG